MAALAVLAGASVELGAGVSYSFGLIILLALSAFFTLGAANILNDIHDRRNDRMNHPERELASGRLGIKEARTAVLLFLTISVLITTYISISEFEPLPVVILLMAILLDLLYESYFKSKGIAGNILIGLLTGSIFIYGGALWTPGPVLLLLASMAAVSTVSREIIKDVQDMEGEIDTRRTLPMRFGKQNSIRISTVVMFLAVSFSIVPGFFIGLNIVYIIFIASADLIMLRGCIVAYERPELGQNLIKLGMLVAVIGFILVSLI